MSFVAIGWQVYSVRENPLDLGLVGLAEFLPLASARAARRTAGRSRAPPEPPCGDGLAQRRRPRRAPGGDRVGCRACVAVLRSGVRPGCRERDRCAGGPRVDSVARPRGDPRERARSAVDRLPAVGGGRTCRRRASCSRSRPSSSTRSRSRSQLDRARGRCSPAQRSRTGGGRRRRVGRGDGGDSADPANERPSWRYLPRPLRRPPRRRRRAPAHLREGHPRGRADGSRSPARRTCGRCARSRPR